MNRLNWTIAAVLGAVTVLTVVLVAAVPLRYQTAATVEHRYVLEEPFSRVRKILVRTNAVKNVVGMTNSEFIDQQWEQLSLDVDRLLFDAQWNVQGEGQLRVRTKDEYVGEHVIDLRQRVDIQPDLMHVTTKLQTPTDRLKDYDVATTFGEDSGGGTLVQSQLTLEIDTSAPLLFRSVARRRVREAAYRSLHGQEVAIRQVVDQHRDEVLILPLDF